jgi:hypothetical protein
MLLFYKHTKFHIPSYSGSLFVTVRAKTNSTFSHGHHVVLHYLSKVAYFSKISYQTISGSYIKGRQSRFHLTNTYVRRAVRKSKLLRRGGLQWHNVNTKFREHWSVGSKVERRFHGHVKMTSYAVFL